MAVPVILPDATADGVAGFSQAQYRRRLADETGRLAILTVSSTPSAAVTPDANRQVLCTGIQSDGKPETRYDGRWLYVVDGTEAGEVRQVLSGTYDGAFGSLLVDRPFSAPLASGTTVELTDTLPARRYGDVIGSRDVLNQALEELPIIDIVSITAVALQVNYSLAGYGWPVKSVTRLFYPRDSTTTESRREVPKCWTLENDAEAPVLAFRWLPFDAGDVFEVELTRPAHTRISVAGTWDNSLVGLVNESDRALYDVGTVVRQAKPIALERMAALRERGSDEWKSLRGEADAERATANLSRFYARFKGSGAQRVRLIGGR